MINVNVASNVAEFPNMGEKANILVGGASKEPVLLPVGTTGFVLTADASRTTGVKWGPVPTTGVATISFGTTGLTPSSAANGIVNVAGVLASKNGGTGYGDATGKNYTVGDILYANSTTTLAALSIPSNGAGKILKVDSNGTSIEWGDVSALANGAAGRVQLSNGSGSFTSNVGLLFTTASSTLSIGDTTTARGTIVAMGNTSGSAGRIQLNASAQAGQGGGAPTSYGGYTVQSPATFPQGAITNATWTLPQQTPSVAGSLLKSSNTGDSTTLAWTASVPIANGGTGLTAAGTKGHVLKSTGSAFSISNRDGSFSAVTVTSSQTVNWNYQANTNLYVNANNGIATLNITNIADGDEGVLIVDDNGGTVTLPTNSRINNTQWTAAFSGSDYLVARFKYYASQFYWTVDSGLATYSP